MANLFAQLSSSLASFLFIQTMYQKYFPYYLRSQIERWFAKIFYFFNPYLEIVFFEFSNNYFKSSQAYTAIENYLRSKSINQARRLRADLVKTNQAVALCMDDYEHITDEFKGLKLFWSKEKTAPQTTYISYYPSASNEKRYYRLKFHRRYRQCVTGSYLKYVLEEGKAIGIKNRQRKLYTNGSGENYSYGCKQTMWNHIVFDHPASFETLAMDPVKKKEIMDDLLAFSKAKEYYKRIGKAWKRGYLLYGPPGTGKSTMIAAIANFLNYDIYDLELTAVKNNTELRKLLIETYNKSIIVIEDIDCSLDLTGQRKKKIAKKIGSNSKEEEEEMESKVTLSGLLNFIDGIWSASGGERIIIFTTNYVEKLDQALVRKGRMDKHIELSYCDFEGFKVLAKNYLNIDSHLLFDPISSLLKESKMTPADVAENLMLKAIEEDAQTCLERLVQALEKTKEEQIKKAGEDQSALVAKKESPIEEKNAVVQKKDQKK